MVQPRRIFLISHASYGKEMFLMAIMDIEKEKEYLKKEHGISSLKELREAAKKLRLDIGIFVTPLPAIPKAAPAK